MIKSSPSLILLRHAERHDIHKDTVGTDVLLTEKGRLDAAAFARTLHLPIVSIASSPVTRCVETAQILAKNLNFNDENIEFDHDLGDPGFFIIDADEAWKHWQEKGHEVVNQYLLSGREHWSGFANLSDSVNNFKQKILLTLNNRQDGLHVWVTHDTILATFASRVLDKPLTSDQWPDYLDYLTVRLVDGELIFDYKNKT